MIRITYYPITKIMYVRGCPVCNNADNIIKFVTGFWYIDTEDGDSKEIFYCPSCGFRLADFSLFVGEK